MTLKYIGPEKLIGNPVVDETDDATDDDLDWLMDSVVYVSSAVAEPAEVHTEEEVRQYNIESEDLHFKNNLNDEDDFLNLTVIDNSVLLPPISENLFEQPVLELVPQIPDWMPDMLTDQYRLIVLVLNAQMIGIASIDPEFDFMENEIIDHIICTIGTGSEFDNQLAILTPEENI
ncbi:uncharacterized protein LOC132946259 isoform X2 [Metopolophium dirhodum]|uniref:uncharacterized protein LOC132946259 isoform X2 n=1 Tax=Metopolophium dirhodum TaxID=44670 RepID=UPI002990235A|nr:uncharacterized protein LOC132946259 isoform X2 [Metopolophium dirhodum]